MGRAVGAWTRGGEFGDEGGEEVRGGGAGGGELRFQRVHQGHQLLHFGHDSAWFGQWWGEMMGNAPLYDSLGQRPRYRGPIIPQALKGRPIGDKVRRQGIGWNDRGHVGPGFQPLIGFADGFPGRCPGLAWAAPLALGRAALTAASSATRAERRFAAVAREAASCVSNASTKAIS